MTSKIAVVTGSNKGIGLAIVKVLCQQQPDWVVYLTARDVGRGQASVEALKQEGVKASFHQLDLDSTESIEGFRAHLEKTHGGLDILINNAGIAFKVASTAPFSEQAEVTVHTNYWGTLNVCNSLFPLLRPHARVVHVSSQASTFALRKVSEQLRKTLTSKLTIDQVSGLMKEFVDSAKDGSFKEKGWPESAYGVSKIGVTCMATVQQEMFDLDPREDIVVNACCPGYVDTDMSSHKGHLKPEQGADTPVYLATLPPNIKEPKGKFLYQRKVVPWQ